MKYLFVLLLSGCASFEGVQMDDKERTACAKEGCSVWTEQDFDAVLRYIFGEGVKAGIQSRGKGI